jgi:hypothetical protein
MKNNFRGGIPYWNIVYNVENITEEMVDQIHSYASLLNFNKPKSFDEIFEFIWRHRAGNFDFKTKNFIFTANHYQDKTRGIKIIDLRLEKQEKFRVKNAQLDSNKTRWSNILSECTDKSDILKVLRNYDIKKFRTYFRR